MPATRSLRPSTPFIRVDLPDPFGPTIATISPLRIVEVDVGQDGTVAVAERRAAQGHDGVRVVRLEGQPGERFS